MTHSTVKANFTQNLKVWTRRLGADLGELTSDKVDLMINQLQVAGYTVPGRQAAIVLAVRNMPEVKVLNVTRDELRTISQMVGAAIYLKVYRNDTDVPLMLLGEIASDKLGRLKCFAAHATFMVALVERALRARDHDYRQNAKSVTGAILGKLPGKVKFG